MTPDFLEAVSFAARAHQGQLRKDNKTPYVSHVFRVCLTVRHVFGLDDPQLLTAAVLHDTVEDTTTDFDDIRQRFGPDIASWVSALSKDKRLEESEREASYCRQLQTAPWQVKVCKLADIHDNLLDVGNIPAERRPRTFANARRYLNALATGLPAEAVAPYRLVSQLLERLETGG